MTTKAEFDAYVAGSLSTLDRANGATMSTLTVSCIIKQLAAKASEVIDADKPSEVPAIVVDAPAQAVEIDPTTVYVDRDSAPVDFGPIPVDPAPIAMTSVLDQPVVDTAVQVDDATRSAPAAYSVSVETMTAPVEPAVPTSEPTDATAI